MLNSIRLKDEVEERLLKRDEEWKVKLPLLIPIWPIKHQLFLFYIFLSVKTSFVSFQIVEL